ncbi:2fb6f880-27f8-494c-9e59-fd1e9b11c012 [Sclerotinia trifoliorum]|uniref:2fb6f880-27f8-494c-9e59-fd1e9b11c012 n=1 Tax=Sclerotinia trifoliorum TaxID=28548 RepID=A0A8H2ZRM4_9HELO|nr:2fb6f880-27f8-494c-9e59-fd1e9b11c012 [Sclerotinia trifoliorum]
MQLSSAFFLALAAATVSGSVGTSESKRALGAAKPIVVGAASGTGATPVVRARFVHGPYRRKKSYESKDTEGAGAAQGTSGASFGEGYGSGSGSAQPSGSGGEAPAESGAASPSAWTGGYGGNATATAEAGSAMTTGTGNGDSGAASASGAGVASATSISPAIPTGGAASLSNNGGTVAVVGLGVAFAIFM